MPTLVQMEVVHYLVRRRGAAAKPAVETFVSQSAEVEPLSGAVTLDAARLLLTRHEQGIGGRDACLLVIARRREAILMTHDRPLAEVAASMGVSTADPAS